MMKYEYVHLLLEWLQAAIREIAQHPSTIGYPPIGSVLLGSLEKAAQDVQSVPLLRLVLQLRQQNERLEKANQNPANTGAVLDTAFALKVDIPAIDAEIRKQLSAYATKLLCLFVVLGAIIFAPHVALIFWH